MMMRAELDAVVCSGPRRGKQFTYALLDERAPQARSLPRDEALAELTRRYFTGHGPAAVSDFVWWSGLTTADARAGLAAITADLAHMVVDGETYHFSPAMPPAPLLRRLSYCPCLTNSGLATRLPTALAEAARKRCRMP